MFKSKELEILSKNIINQAVNKVKPVSPLEKLRQIAQQRRSTNKW